MADTDTECPAIGVGGVHSESYLEGGVCVICGETPPAEARRLVDKRASRRRESLYEGMDPGEANRLEHINSTRTSVLRWAPGDNPHEQMADELHGYEDIKLEVMEDQSRTEKERFGGIRGEDSGIPCFECKVNHYRIIDERTAAQVIAEQPDLDWAQKMNRPLDFWRSQAQFLMFCPGCKAVAQMGVAVVRLLQGQQARKDGA